jgi:ABC-type transport system involved in multi-copper enzyme maturation permease subunit
VNATLVAAFLRQRLTSPMRLGLLFLVVTFPLGASALMRTLEPLTGLAGPLALILAAGGIGQDVSSGTLQLLLVRPVSRPSLLVSRWLACTLAAVVMVVGSLALGTIALLLRGTHPDGLDLVRIVLESLCSAAGHAAVMLMLSTLVNGLGDLGIYVGTFFVTQMLSGLAMLQHWPWLARASTEVQRVLDAQLAWAWLAHGTAPSWFAIASWASTLTLALAVGIYALNRRELSYAAG